MKVLSALKLFFNEKIKEKEAPPAQSPQKEKAELITDKFDSLAWVKGAIYDIVGNNKENNLYKLETSILSNTGPGQSMEHTLTRCWFKAEEIRILPTH